MAALFGLAYILFDPIVKHIILQKLVLRNNSDFAQIWQKPDITPHLKVHTECVQNCGCTLKTLVFQIYFFNLTNAEDFFAGKAIPRLEEVGPYVYQ